MATSIKRVLAMLILIDILIITISGFLANTSIEEVTEIGLKQNNLEGWSQNFTDNFMNVAQDSQIVQLDKSAGDSKYGQIKIYELLKDGINYPFTYTCIDQTCSNTYQSQIANGLKWFIIIVHIFALADILFITYSKKYD